VKLEVIIPTLNRPDDLSSLFQSLLLQTRTPEFVTIVDAGTLHANYELYKKNFHIQSTEFKIISSQPGLTYQRNLGIHHASGDILLFLDDDTIIESQYVEKIIRIFINDTENKIGGVTGRIINVSFHQNIFNKRFRNIFYLPVSGKGELLRSGFGNSISHLVSDQIKIGWLSGCNMAYRKEVCIWNFFDENLKSYAYAEDLDFSTRVGKNYSLIYEPQAILEHRISPTNRISEFPRYKMLVLHHSYLFFKNHNESYRNRFAFYLSLIGLTLQSLFLKRSIRGFLGSLCGLIEISLFRNYSLPNYLERLDFMKPDKKQIASHIFRYQEISRMCSGLNVLDCACGEGIGVNLLARIARNVTGVDINPETIKKALSLVQTSNVRFIQGSALKLPFEDSTFEVVTSVETIEHIPQQYHNQLLSEFRRVLKPSGKFYLTTPNKDRTSPGRVTPGNYFHIAELTPETLIDLLSGHFEDVQIYGIFNFTREGTIDKIKLSSQTNNKFLLSPRKLTFRKKILLLIPNWLRNYLSIILTGDSIFPKINEFILDKNNFKFASNLFCICSSPNKN